MCFRFYNRDGEGQGKAHSSSTSPESLQIAGNSGIDIDNARNEKGQTENWSTTPITENSSFRTTADTSSLSKFYPEESRSHSGSNY